MTTISTNNFDILFVYDYTFFVYNYTCYESTRKLFHSDTLSSTQSLPQSLPAFCRVAEPKSRLLGINTRECGLWYPLSRKYCPSPHPNRTWRFGTRFRSWEEHISRTRAAETCANIQHSRSKIDRYSEQAPKRDPCSCTTDQAAGTDHSEAGCNISTRQG